MDRRVSLFTAVSALIVAGFVAAPPSGAVAHVDHFVISGGGDIVPGLTVLPAPQMFNFDGAGTSEGTDSGGVACVTEGNGIDDNYTMGAGTFEAECRWSDGYTDQLACTWDRSGVEVEFVCIAPATAHGDCVFVPGQTPPATVVNYTLTCSVTYEG